LDSPSRQTELAGAGRERAAMFPWTSTAAATLAIYEELTG
jgi:glycosyltransferase involved in cell wall biosynthesis